MTKGLKYLGDKDGKPQFEEIEVEEIIIEQQYNYGQLITEYIREKYSIDDEFALNSKSMQMYFNNCTDEQRDKWMIEFNEFTNYRQQCIIRAREVCGIV